MKGDAVIVVYMPMPLRSMGEICDVLGVGQRTVKQWVEQGAPIAIEGKGARTRYSAELIRLQLWRESVEPAADRVNNTAHAA